MDEQEKFDKRLIESLEHLMYMRDRMRNAMIVPWDKYLESVNQALNCFFERCSVSYKNLQDNPFKQKVFEYLESVAQNSQDYHDALNEEILKESANFKTIWKNYFFPLREDLTEIKKDVKVCLNSESVSQKDKKDLYQNFCECVDLYNAICDDYNALIKNYQEIQMKVYAMEKYENLQLNRFDKNLNDKEK